MDKIKRTHITECVITYPCWDKSQTMLVKGGPALHTLIGLKWVARSSLAQTAVAPFTNMV